MNMATTAKWLVTLIWCRFLYYTVCRKISHFWLAITLTYVNGFWYF